MEQHMVVCAGVEECECWRSLCVWEVCLCVGVVRLVSFVWLFKQKVNRKEKTFMSHDK